jgi:hypothetical protein
LLLHSHGYTVVRELSDMVMDLAQPIAVPSMVNTVECRRVEPGDFRAIHEAYKDAYAQMTSTAPVSNEDYREFVGDHFAVDRFDPDLCKVAWSGNEVVGLVLGRERAGAGIIGKVNARRMWQPPPPA